MSNDQTPVSTDKPATTADNPQSDIEPSWFHKNSTLLITITGTLLVAILSGIFALVGSRIGADGAFRAGIAQQQAALDSTRTEEARKKRGEVYAALLESADALEAEIDRVVRAQERNNSNTYEDLARLIAASTLQKGNMDMRSKMNQVYVYGSDEGLAAALELESTVMLDLQPTVDTVKIEKVKTDEYLKNYGALQRVMCREASAQPRRGCT
ncbi:hypothetical protein LFM09_27575 [Lentzea alba]|uniref:hypothetical protein n=1 Tax=Lentzea alba TaxID=2714351 RepID=UPI0039BF7B98